MVQNLIQLQDELDELQHRGQGGDLQLPFHDVHEDGDDDGQLPMHNAEGFPDPPVEEGVGAEIPEGFPDPPVEEGVGAEIPEGFMDPPEEEGI